MVTCQELAGGKVPRRRRGDPLEPVPNCPPRPFEADVSAVLYEAAVGPHEKAAQLPGDLVGVNVRLELPQLPGGADRAAEAGDPIVSFFDHRIPHPARLAVELRHGRLEETPPREYLSLEI